MSFLVPPRQFSDDEKEMMDLPNIEPLVLEDDLAFIRSINRHLGGYSLIRQLLSPVENETDSVSVLDCCTGSGDIPALLLDSKLGGITIRHLVALDFHSQTIRVAGARLARTQCEAVQGSIHCLPFADRSFDLVMCHLALHHFSMEDAAVAIREMSRVSRKWVLITDLQRHRFATVGAMVLCRLTRNPISRNDALQSARRAFSQQEFQDLIDEAHSLRLIRSARNCFFRQGVLCRVSP